MRDRSFRRTLVVIAALHVVVVVVLYLWGSFGKKPEPQQVMWIDGGSIGGGEPGASEPNPPTPEPEPESKPEPPPPDPKPELVAVPPPEPKAASELVTPQATPEPTTPKPSTPKPETPKPTTPKPTPKVTPKPKPTTPKATPKKASTASPKPKASPTDKPKSTPGAAKSEGAASAAGNKAPGPMGGNGTGTGNGKGPGKAGGGSGASEFGWYFSMIHDRFHNRWDQPTTVGGAQGLVTTLKIRIAKDGSILHREIVNSSGDTTMDQSVMTAAERVLQIDPLPAGLGSGDSFEVNIAFKLDQGQ